MLQSCALQQFVRRFIQRSQGVGIGVGVVLGTISALAGHASVSHAGVVAADPIALQLAERPPVPGTDLPPGRRRGAGSFSGCTLMGERDPAKLLVALMPEVQSADGRSVVLAETQRDRPTLWFYVGYPAGTLLELVLQDAAGNTLDRQQRTMGPQPGLVGLAATRGLALAAGQDYRWYLKVRCAGPNSSPDDYVNGTLRRLPGDRTSNLPWLDRLDAALSPTGQAGNGGGGRSPWAGLLEQVGLGDLTEARPVASP